METTKNTKAPARIHPFEVAGLGRAPFRCVDVAKKTYQACPGAPVQPGDYCRFCGTGIMIVCTIKSADGRTFVVGSDCVEKCADAYQAGCAGTDEERAAREAYNVIMAPIRKHRAALRKALAERKAAGVAELLADDANRDKLAALPHPRGFAGLTLLDWAEWMLANAGAKGKTAVAKTLAEVLAE